MYYPADASAGMSRRRTAVVPHCSAQERLKHYRGNRSSGMPRYQHFVESERILAMLANNTLPITVRPLPAHLPPLMHGARGREHAAGGWRPSAVFSLLVWVLT
jgi:hypothetical protein